MRKTAPVSVAPAGEAAAAAPVDDDDSDDSSMLAAGEPVKSEMFAAIREDDDDDKDVLWARSPLGVGSRQVRPCGAASNGSAVASVGNGSAATATELCAQGMSLGGADVVGDAAPRPSSLRPPPLWEPTWAEWYESEENRRSAEPASGKPPQRKGTVLVRRHKDHKPFALCTIPRNGCSRWRRLCRRAEGFDDFDKDPHDRDTNGLRYVDDLSQAEQHKLWSTPQVFKIFMARNPMERVLSAYLSKREEHDLPGSFSEFVAFLGHRKWPDIDAHWRSQLSLCHSPKMYHYDFIARVEDRDKWQGQLFKFLNLGPYVQSGWGDKGDESFGAAEDEIGSPTTAATRVGALRNHYTPETFKRTMCHYRRDIKVLGYKDDVLGEGGLWQSLYPDLKTPSLASCHGSR